MEKSYSIAEARNDLASIVHDVEGASAVELTRRGRPVAVLLSVEEYRRLAAGGRICGMLTPGFGGGSICGNWILGPKSSKVSATRHRVGG